MPSSRVRIAKSGLIFICLVAIFDLIVIGIPGLALGLSPRILVLPFVLMCLSTLIGLALIYWSRRTFGRPRLFAFRFAFSALIYALLFMLGLLYSAEREGPISNDALLHTAFSAICLVSISAGVSVYFSLRNRRKTSSRRTAKDQPG